MFLITMLKRVYDEDTALCFAITKNGDKRFKTPYLVYSDWICFHRSSIFSFKQERQLLI